MVCLKVSVKDYVKVSNSKEGFSALFKLSVVLCGFPAKPLTPSKKNREAIFLRQLP